MGNTISGGDQPRAYAGLGEVALATGAVAAGRALGPTMVPRGAGLTAGLVGTSAGMGMAAGVAGEGVARGLDAATGLDRLQSHLAVGALGAVTAIAGRRFSGLAPATTASIGATLAVTGTAGAGLDVAHAQLDRDEDGRMGPDLPNLALLGGAGAVATLAALKFAPQGITMLRNSKNLAVGGAQADAAGAALGETIPRSKLGTPGRMFLEGRTPGLDTEPVRTYMPYKLDDLSLDERVAATVDSMVSQGAFERSKIVIGSPTGTGAFNPVATTMDEVLSKGDTAWVVAQYGKSPSVASLHKIPDAVESYIALTRAIADTRAKLHPSGGGPELFGASTSLGAANLDEVVRLHGDELFGPHIRMQRTLQLGEPAGLSKLDTTTLPPGSVARIETPADAAAISDEAAKSLRMVKQVHSSDPVSNVSFRMLVERPEFLSSAIATGGHGGRSFTPGVTMLQHGFDVLGSISKSTSDTVAAFGHDYRGDMDQALALAFKHRDKGSAALDAAATFAQERAIADVRRVKGILAGTS